MKKILILTQSSVDGMNYRLAKECQAVCSPFGESTIANASSIPPSSMIEYSHIIMVVPEWNGSFPFMFKQLIDSSGYPSNLKEKNVLLIGTSDTTFGNIMGVKHLQHILEWCEAVVFKKQVFIPNIRSYSFDKHEEPNERLQKAINKFLA